jgi:fibro-slime domain-containing protein
VKTGTLILTKKISKKDIRACEGDPIFTFKITNQTTGDVYYKTLRFGENSAEDQTTTAGMFNVKAQTTLEGLAQGIYKVEELDTMGFTLKEFTADTNCASQIAGNSAQFAVGIRYDVTFTLGDYIGELNYSFTGDDDLWVILDGKQVVIDLGGIHDALTDTVDLWKYIDRTDKNKEHHLTILYMERGAGKANCNMKFTLPNADVIKVVDDDVPDIPPEEPVDFTEKDVEYHKTVKLTDWENREYQIDLDASSLATSQSTVEKIQTVDAMMVFDLSGSMNEILSGENQLKDIGEFSSVKSHLDINKVYYWNKYEKSGWWPWTYDKSVGMGTAAVSGNVYAKYPVKYIDGQWKKYVDGSYQSISDSDVMAAWTSKISALKDAASGFVTGISDTSPDSLVGIATFYGIGNGWNSSTEGKLNHGLSKVNKNEMLKSVNALSADGGTSPQKGLEHAYSELQKAEDDNKKYVILFSDGEPSDSNDKTETEASAVKLNYSFNVEFAFESSVASSTGRNAFA